MSTATSFLDFLDTLGNLLILWAIAYDVYCIVATVSIARDKNLPSPEAYGVAAFFFGVIALFVVHATPARDASGAVAIPSAAPASAAPALAPATAAPASAAPATAELPDL